MLKLTEQQIINVLDDTAYCLAKVVGLQESSQLEDTISKDVVIDFCESILLNEGYELNNDGG